VIRAAETVVPGQRVSITIDGRPVQARAGHTVLRAARDAGIDIPTLCDHPALPPTGACRVCMVEIERQRALQPSCTFPVTEGLVIRTDTPRVLAARRFAVEMLLSERPHYCMTCPVSGGEHTSDCELQRVAYRLGMDRWAYPPDTSLRWPVDATRPHMVMDHGRCILCRRCVRACSTLVANHTLAVHFRGARSTIGADDQVPFGESTCVNCGTCMQVCPTGAIIDRHSAFRGHEADVQRTRTVCMACGVGCPIDTVTRHNRLLRVEGVWDGSTDGVLCELGRFDVLEDHGPRLSRPLVRDAGGLREATWDEALARAADGLRGAGPGAAGGLITARSTNQSLLAFTRFFREALHSDRVALLSGATPPLDLGAAADMADVARADCVAIINGDPARTHKVLAYLARRACDRGARLVVASADPTGLDDFADLVVRLQREAGPRADPHDALRFTYHVRPDRLAEVRGAIERAAQPVVIHGPGLDKELLAALRSLPARTRFLPLVDQANAVGAGRLGLEAAPVAADALYVMASDEDVDDRPPPAAGFLVVQSSYRTPWADAADVALPSKAWFEKQGDITSFAGHRLRLTRPVDAPGDILPDWVTLFMLSVRLGRPLSCVNVSDDANPSLGG